jgi:hypothetical protein
VDDIPNLDVEDDIPNLDLDKLINRQNSNGEFTPWWEKCMFSCWIGAWSQTQHLCRYINVIRMIRHNSI